jgi:hypothetical protein
LAATSSYFFRLVLLLAPLPARICNRYGGAYAHAALLNERRQRAHNFFGQRLAKS